MEFEAAAGELVRRQDIEDAGREIGTFFREHMMHAAEPIGALIADRFKIDYGGAVAVATIGITKHFNGSVIKSATTNGDLIWVYPKKLMTMGKQTGLPARWHRIRKTTQV